MKTYCVSNDKTRIQDAITTTLKQILPRGFDLMEAQPSQPIRGTPPEATEAHRQQYYGKTDLFAHRINDTRTPEVKALEEQLVRSLGDKIVVLPTAHRMAIQGMVHGAASALLEQLGQEIKKDDSLTERFRGLQNFVTEFSMCCGSLGHHEVALNVNFDHTQQLFLIVKSLQHDPMWRECLLREFNAQYRDSYWLMCSHQSELHGGAITHAPWQPLDEVAVAESISKLAAFLEREDDFSIMA